MREVRGFNRGEEITRRMEEDVAAWEARRVSPDPWWAWPVVAGVIGVWVCGLVLAGWRFVVWVTL
jgi:hypothetical protein